MIWVGIGGGNLGRKFRVEISLPENINGILLISFSSTLFPVRCESEDGTSVPRFHHPLCASPSTPPSALNVLHLIRYPADVAIKGDSLTSRQDVPGSLQSRMCGKSTYIS